MIMFNILKMLFFSSEKGLNDQNCSSSNSYQGIKKVFYQSFPFPLPLGGFSPTSLWYLENLVHCLALQHMICGAMDLAFPNYPNAQMTLKQV